MLLTPHIISVMCLFVLLIPKGIFYAIFGIFVLNIGLVVNMTDDCNKQIKLEFIIALNLLKADIYGGD